MARDAGSRSFDFTSRLAALGAAQDDRVGMFAGGGKSGANHLICPAAKSSVAAGYEVEQ